MRSAPPAVEDRTARARIRDAAITRFAADGIAATSVRAIAAEAGVSPGLVIHHFGTKDGLRYACDEYVAAIIRSNKQEAMARGPALDVAAAMRRAKQDVPLTRYLARSLADGSPHVATLIDELVADAGRYMAEGVRAGALRPTDYPYGRAAVLTIWTLGAIVLHEHIERLLGVDLTQDPSELADGHAYTAYIGPVLELFTEGLVTEEVAKAMRAAFVDGAEPEEGTES
jgi:AcrR family transcriptional regulator